MLHLLTSNTNGKLLLDTFPELLPWNPQVWFVGAHVQVRYGKMELGEAQITAARSFKLINLTEAMSQVVYGHSVRYTHTVLLNRFPECTHADYFGIFFFKWTHRNEEAQRHLTDLRLKHLFPHSKKNAA